MEIGFTKHGVFGDQTLMLEIEHVGRDQPIGRCQPSLCIGFPVVRDDKVKIEHQPVELLLPETRAVEQHRPRCFAVLPRDRSGDGGNTRVNRLAEFLGD